MDGQKLLSLWAVRIDRRVFDWKMMDRSVGCIQMFF